jgi:predicted aldo/keto reductase-like oxidoreductase
MLAASLGLPLVAAARSWNRPIPLGKTGLEVTPLGMGCEEVKDPGVIRRAVDLGIRYFHALSNLELVGQALKPVRDHVVLGAGSSEDTALGLERDLSRQLRALGTGHIDLWYLTSKYRPELITDELMECVQRAKQAGKIRACAIAGHGLAAVAPRLLELGDVIGAAMVVCNFATWEHPFASTDRVPSTSLPGGRREDVIRLHDAGIGIASMKPMMGGLKYVPAERRSWADSVDREDRRRAALSAALKWVLRNPHVDTTPVQMQDLEQLEANAKSAAESFSGADQNLLAAEVGRASPYYCRMCLHCQGACRQGLPVADVLRCLMYADGYGNQDRARQEFRTLTSPLQAIRCGDCDGCTVRCPSGVQVRQQMARAQVLLA